MIPSSTVALSLLLKVPRMPRSHSAFLSSIELRQILPSSVSESSLNRLSSEQATLALRFDGTVSAGAVVRIEDADGTAVLTWEASKPFESLVLSSPEIEAGKSYEVLLEGEVSGDSLGGLYLEPDYTGGTSVGTVAAQG